MENLRIYAGDTFNFSATITDGLAPEDCSAYTAYYRAIDNTTDENTVLDLSTNTWDSSTALFTGTAEDSSLNWGKYPSLWRINDGSNNFTVDRGTLEILNVW